MHICFISAGEFWFIDCYISYFQSIGYEVSFITLSPSPKRSATVYDLSFGGEYSPWKGKWKYLVSAFKIRKLLKKIKPDVVHTHYATSGGLAGFLAGFHPTVVTAHGSDVTVGVTSKVWRYLLRKIFNHADCINCVSDDLKRMALSLGLKHDNIKVIPVGIDSQQYAYVTRKPLDQDRAVKIVCTRRLEQLYNHITIVKALAILHHQGVNFCMTFVGGGTTLHLLEKVVSDEGMQDKVIFRGMLENNLLPGILQENDIYLSASIRDGTSLSLLEAMATGIFPIVSNIPANTDWLEDGVNAYLHQVGDPKSLSDSIMKYLKNSNDFNDVPQKNRAKVVARGDRVKSMEALDSIYKGLVTREKR